MNSIPNQRIVKVIPIKVINMTWKEKIAKYDYRTNPPRKRPILGSRAKKTDEEVIDEARELIVKAFSMLEKQLGSDEGLDKFEYLVDDLLKSM